MQNDKKQIGQNDNGHTLQNDSKQVLLSDSKQVLRKEIKKRLSGLTEKEKAAASDLIAKQLFALDEFKAASRVFLYLSMADEVDTDCIIKECFKLEKQVFVPEILSDDEMKFFEILPETEFSISKFGFKTPIAAIKQAVASENSCVVITPLRAFDRSLARLGRGGGYYDKFFEKYSDVKKIGIAFAVQEVESVPCEMHDIKLDVIITENEVLEKRLKATAQNGQRL